MFRKQFYLQIITASVFLFIILQSTILNPSQAANIPCGIPNYDKASDRGVFLWKNCGTGQWFFRVSSGGEPASNEYRVSGSLKLTKPIQSIVEFEPDNIGQDLLDTSDPENIKFTFRVWGDNQDGFDFKLQNDTTACLKISDPGNTSVVIGGMDTTVDGPANIESLNNQLCINLSSVTLMLLAD